MDRGFGISKPLQFLAKLVGAHVVNTALFASKARLPCFGAVQIPELQVTTDAVDAKQTTLRIAHKQGRALVVNEDLDVTGSGDVQHCCRRLEIFTINVREEAVGR